MYTSHTVKETLNRSSALTLMKAYMHIERQLPLYIVPEINVSYLCCPVFKVYLACYLVHLWKKA